MENTKAPLWVRSKDGWFLGVCEGVAKIFELNPNLVRFIWFVSSICLFVPLPVYFILAITLPTEDKVEKALQPKILGVCWRLSQRFEIEIGLMRALAFMILFLTGGAGLILYLIVHIIFVSDKNQ